MKDDDKKKVLNIAKHYNNIEHAERYFRCGPPVNISDRIRDKEFQTVFSNLNLDELPSNNPKALDIGVGGGRYTMYLVKRGINTIGIDTGINLLKWASERVDATFIRASVTDLPFKKEVFDLVICIELLHHFEDEVLEKVLEEIRGVIKPGGIFVFDVKNKMNLYLKYKYKDDERAGIAYRARTIRQMIKFAENNGFKFVKKKGIYFPITLFASFIIVFCKKSNK